MIDDLNQITFQEKNEAENAAQHRSNYWTIPIIVFPFDANSDIKYAVHPLDVLEKNTNIPYGAKIFYPELIKWESAVDHAIREKDLEKRRKYIYGEWKKDEQ